MSSRIENLVMFYLKSLGSLEYLCFYNNYMLLSLAVEEQIYSLMRQAVAYYISPSYKLLRMSQALLVRAVKKTPGQERDLTALLASSLRHLRRSTTVRIVDRRGARGEGEWQEDGGGGGEQKLGGEAGIAD